MRSRVHKNTQVKESLPAWQPQRKRLLAVHRIVKVLADQRSLSILTVNLSFNARAGAGRQKQCEVLSVCASLWHNTHAYCFALCTVRVTYMPCWFYCLVQHKCSLFLLYAVSVPYTFIVGFAVWRIANAVLLSMLSVSHMFIVGSAVWYNANAYCFTLSAVSVTYTFIVGFAVWRITNAYCFALYAVSVTYTFIVGSAVWYNTNAYGVSLSPLSVSCTFIVGSSLWCNTHAYCFALYTVSVTYMPCWFCCLEQHVCVTIISFCGIQMEACFCSSLPLLHSLLSGIVYVHVCFNVFPLS